MRHQKPTLTIAIPSHNEANTIARCLNSVISQYQSSYILKEVIVVCDGCTDSTEKIAKSFLRKLPGLKIHNDHLHLGKIVRLNQLFKNNSSDILFLLDADSTFGRKDSLDQIASDFSNPNIGLVAANDHPYPASSFFESVVVAGIELWYDIRKNINGTDTVHNVHGCGVAISDDLAKKVKIPEGIVADDEYLYFATKAHRKNVKLEKDSLVCYQAPKNYSDYFRQSARFIGTKKLIIDHFGGQFEKSYHIPMSIKINGTISSLSKRFLLTICYLILHLVTRIISPIYSTELKKITWSPIASSKIKYV